MVERLALWLRSLKRWTALYVLALLLVVASWLTPVAWRTYFYYVAIVLFATGFSMVLWPVLASIWRSTWGKLTIAALNVIVVVLARIYADHIVAAAMGLPPEKFGHTADALTVFLAIPVAAMLACLALCILSFALFVSGMAVQAVRKPPEAGLVVWGHAAGAMILVGLMQSSLTRPLGWVNAPPAWVATIAYLVDFHVLPNLPGAPPAQRVRLLDDGWLAVANMKDGDVTVRLQPALLPQVAEARELVIPAVQPVALQKAPAPMVANRQ